MVLDFTPEQQAFKSNVERFAADVVAPRAAHIDETGEFPADLIAEAARQGLAGVTLPVEWGGAGRDYAVCASVARGGPG